MRAKEGISHTKEAMHHLEESIKGRSIGGSEDMLLPTTDLVTARDQAMHQRLSIGFLGRPGRVRITDRSEHDTAVRDPQRW